MKAHGWMRVLVALIGILLAGVIAAPIALSSQDIVAWASSPSGLGLAPPWDVITFLALDAAAAVCVGMVVYAAWRGEPGGAFGVLVWVFALGSAYANYRHGTRPGAPADAWWFFPAMSLAGPTLLEVTTRRVRRWVQVAAGRYEPPLPHFRLARWLPGIAMRETARAWRLAVTEGFSRPEDAITAARAVVGEGAHPEASSPMPPTGEMPYATPDRHTLTGRHEARRRDHHPVPSRPTHRADGAGEGPHHREHAGGVRGADVGDRAGAGESGVGALPLGQRGGVSTPKALQQILSEGGDLTALTAATLHPQIEGIVGHEVSRKTVEGALYRARRQRHSNGGVSAR